MVRKLKHCCYLIPGLFGLWFHWMGVSVIATPLEGADLAKYTRYVRKLAHDSQRNQILMGKNTASRFCRAAFKEWAKSYVRLENTLQKEPFFKKQTNISHLSCSLPYLQLFFSFFSEIILQNIIIQSFQGVLPIFTLACFVRPHYTSDLATSHCGQIFQNIPFF